MMKTHLRLLPLAAGLAFSSVLQHDEAGSALQHYGDTTYDPNTGLEWLDLDLTAGHSYSAVLNGWGGYTTSEGYRFATRSEVVAQTPANDQQFYRVRMP